MDAFLHQGADDVRLLFGGEDQHAHLREIAAQSAEYFDATDARHEDIEDQDIGPKTQGLFDSLGAVRGGARDFAEREMLHHFGDEFADGGLIFDDEDTLLWAERVVGRQRFYF